jgi:hypothetical protein
MKQYALWKKLKLHVSCDSATEVSCRALSSNRIFMWSSFGCTIQLKLLNGKCDQMKWIYFLDVLKNC